MEWGRFSLLSYTEDQKKYWKKKRKKQILLPPYALLQMNLYVARFTYKFIIPKLLGDGPCCSSSCYHEYTINTNIFYYCTHRLLCTTIATINNTQFAILAVRCRRMNSPTALLRTYLSGVKRGKVHHAYAYVCTPPPLYTSLLFSVRFSKPIKHGETLEQKQTQQVQRHVSTALLLLLTFFWSNHSSVGACPMNECCSALQQ